MSKGFLFKFPCMHYIRFPQIPMMSNCPYLYGKLWAKICKNNNSDRSTTIRLTNCYYAGTLTMLGSKTGRSMVGNYNGDSDLEEYIFANCFYDKRLMTDNTDYQTLMGVDSPEQMRSYIYGFETTDVIGEDIPFTTLVNEEEWIFAENRYPQLKSIKDTPVSTLAVTPIFFKGNENAERVYLGVTLTEAKYGGQTATWSAPIVSSPLRHLHCLT